VSVRFGVKELNGDARVSDVIARIAVAGRCEGSRGNSNDHDYENHRSSGNDHGHDGRSFGV
jgi:hypothetical protein